MLEGTKEIKIEELIEEIIEVEEILDLDYDEYLYNSSGYLAHW
jgi:hypothetical protein